MLLNKDSNPHTINVFQLCLESSLIHISNLSLLGRDYKSRPAKALVIFLFFCKKLIADHSQLIPLFTPSNFPSPPVRPASVSPYGYTLHHAHYVLPLQWLFPAHSNRLIIASPHYRWLNPGFR